MLWDRSVISLLHNEAGRVPWKKQYSKGETQTLQKVKHLPLVGENVAKKGETGILSAKGMQKVKREY